MKTINLELGMPYVDEAMDRLDKGIKDAKASGENIIKIIHGYGSHGKGGAIREACRESLSNNKNIKKIVYGEDFKILNKNAYDMKTKEPSLEELFHMNNKGVTIIEI